MDILISALQAVWQVALVGLLLGAGLPALFAVGMRSLASGRAVSADGTTFDGPPTVTGRIGAAVCFGICIAAVAFGIVVIIFGDQLFG